jgi:hypothetical protein
MWFSNIRYEAGWNDHKVATQQGAIEEQNKAIEKRMAEWIATQAAAEPVIITEEKIVEKIRVVTKEVPKVVEKFVAAECRDLGPEYAGLLNDAVRASNQRSDESTSATTDVDATL